MQSQVPEITHPSGHNDPSLVTAVIERAPAKINLALHVTGQRGDGYHELDSLVTFANVVDRVRVSPARQDELTLSGAYAKDLCEETSNLVEQARDTLRALLAELEIAAPPVAIHLEKNLPVASGIGGGSADAAAALRALVRLWQARLTQAELNDLGRSIGADVPMCLASRPLEARGIGDIVRPLAPFPTFDMVLVNPGCPVSTPAVFRSLTSRRNPPLKLPPRWGRLAQSVALLQKMRNDLQEAALKIAPAIADALGALDNGGALLARMSGSGATCFGIFSGGEAARAAAGGIRRQHPDWYVTDCRTFYGIQEIRHDLL